MTRFGMITPMERRVSRDRLGRVPPYIGLYALTYRMTKLRTVTRGEMRVSVLVRHDPVPTVSAAVAPCNTRPLGMSNSNHISYYNQTTEMIFDGRE